MVYAFCPLLAFRILCFHEIDLKTLDDLTFIIQITYGVVALPLYIATFVAILQTKARKGTFFRCSIASGVVVSLFFTVPQGQLLLYCPATELFSPEYHLIPG